MDYHILSSDWVSKNQWLTDYFKRKWILNLNRLMSTKWNITLLIQIFSSKESFWLNSWYPNLLRI